MFSPSLHGSKQVSLKELDLGSFFFYHFFVSGDKKDFFLVEIFLKFCFDLFVDFSFIFLSSIREIGDFLGFLLYDVFKKIHFFNCLFIQVFDFLANINLKSFVNVFVFCSCITCSF